MLSGKKIILAVSGSIAAYKSALIIRLLIKAGASVKVIMTEASEHFITPLTLSTLSKSPVLKDFTKDDDSGEWNNHVELGLWADAIIVAPATANTMAKMVSGHADSLLLAVYLSARCPVFVAPAMDLDMYQHGSTQDNLKILIERGNLIIQPESGELASGLIGEGRLTEPEHILEFLCKYFTDKASLNGLKVMVSAGPTHEPIDPVRFIGNHSSGKMGFALAEEAAKRGADVTLIAGPVSLETPHGVNRINVKTAQDMFDACAGNFDKQDIIIMAAAVADYTPKVVALEKVKKKAEDWNIALKKTKDVLAWIGENKRINQKLIGFALETENEQANALAKLERKNLDIIVLNSLKDQGAGFQYNSNKVTIIDRNNKVTNFELKSKEEVAIDILDAIENY
jgi:phosphopantothenoylcysteine decarboxylase / phosphopantothenate---cysteine ligase